MTKHTATPWKTIPSDTVINKNGTQTAMIGEEVGFNFIKVTVAGTWAREEAESTAAFIVTACNSHEELVEALRKAVKTLELAARRDPDQAGLYYCLEARKALAKVRGEA